MSLLKFSTNKLFTSINLIRVELIYAALFEQFFSLVFAYSEKITFSFYTINILSIIALLIFLFSFFSKWIKNNLRSLSNLCYLSALLFVIYVAYINEFNKASFFIVILSYSFFSFMLSSVRVYFRLNVAVFVGIFGVLSLLKFKTVFPLHLILFSFLVIGSGGLLLTFARSLYRKKIKEREEFLNFIFNSSSDGLILIDKGNQEIFDLNQTALKILGVDKVSKLLNTDLSKVSVTGYSIFKNNELGKGSHELKDGRILLIEVKDVFYKERSLNLIEIKQFENQLHLHESSKFEQQKRYSEETFHYLFEESSSLMCVIDENGKIINVNKTLSNLVGYEKEELIGQYYDFFTFKEASNRDEFNKRAWNGETVSFEKTLMTKKGETILIELELRLGSYFGKNVLISNGRSIEERKKLENEIYNSYERYRNVTELSPIGFVMANTDGEIINTNRAFAKMLGYEYDALIGVQIESLSYPEDMELNNSIRQQLIDDKIAVGEMEKRYVKKNGDIVFALLKLTLQKDVDNKPNLFFAQIVDITEILKTQKELESSEKSYRDLFNNSNDLLYVLNRNNMFVDVNNSVIEKYGYTREEILGQTPALFSAPELNDLEETYKKMNAAWNGETITMLWWSIKKNGEIFPKQLILRRALYNGQEGLIANGRDVSESYNYEKQLEEKEKRYRHLFQRNLAGVYRTTKKGEIIECNEAFTKIFGFTALEIENRKIVATNFYADQNDRERLIKKLEKTKVLIGEKLKLLKKNGQRIDVLLNISSIYDENNDFLYFEGSIFDITEFEEAQEKLRESEKRHKQLIDSSSFGILIVRRGKIMFANSKAAQILGFSSKNEMYGIETDKIIFKHDAPKFQEIYLRLKGGEEIPFTELSVKKYNGEIADVEGKPIFSLFDGEKCIQVSFIDITDKRRIAAAVEKIKATEKFNEILQIQLKEKEVLLKEVHHRVKNNLQVVTSILSLQSSYIEDVKVKSLLSESQNRIRSMALIHEKLYTTKDFSKISFSNYVKDLAENIFSSYRNSSQNVELKFDLNEMFLNLDAAIPCGLIINELISNCLKYAFVGKKEGFVSIELKEENNRITLRVRDNGIGIPKNVEFKETDSLGLQLVNILVEQLEGTISLLNENGADFIIEFIRTE